MWRILFISLFLLACKLGRVDAVVTYASSDCDDGYGNYSKNSIYKQNLNLLFSNFSSQAPLVKFYNSTKGKTPDKVYGLFQCREDLSLDVCGECIRDATRKIVEVRPLFGEAIVWYEERMLRYANLSIFFLSELSPSYQRWSIANFSNYEQFPRTLASTMNALISETAQSTQHFATREVNMTVFNQLYTLAQCTPGLNEFQCNSCLKSALSELSICCSTSTRGLVFLPSCHLRFATSPFYNVTDKSLATPPSRQPRDPDDKKLKTPAIVGIAVAAFVGTALLLCVIWLCLKQRKPRRMSMEVLPEESKVLSDDKAIKGDGADNLGDVKFMQYDFATMKAATSDFSLNNKLGEGGFGVVYKGTLESGQEVAIKRLSPNSGQGAREFMTEAKLVAKLQNRNLVKLLGFCSQGEEKILVYEFMPNTSLDRFLFDPTKGAFLEWDARYKIMMGIARGLQYLHEDFRLKIIHRDPKTSNILLDSNMNLKIADFGMARLWRAAKFWKYNGYIAPEYVLAGEYSDKSDVFSFGVIVLEIVSGQKNKILYHSRPKEVLPFQAWRLWNEGRAFELIDPTFQRPTMVEIVVMLAGSVTLPSPSTPEMSM